MVQKLNSIFVLLVALALLLTACGGGGDDKPAATQPPATQPPAAQSAGDPVKGKELYAACAGCHGPNGEGVENLGKSWQGSTFIQGTTDDEMLAFIKQGRPIGDPENTTGVDMPPKGGNPALSDDDIRDIIAFMRTLQ